MTDQECAIAFKVMCEIGDAAALNEFDRTCADMVDTMLIDNMSPEWIVDREPARSLPPEIKAKFIEILNWRKRFIFGQAHANN